VIPARYASERFPAKPLALIDGVPMVVRVLRNLRSAASVSDVIVATDDDRIASVVEEAGGHAVMTDPALPSGSDRVWAAVAERPADVVVNVQGDEPLVPGAMVDAIVQGLLADARFDIATPVVAVSRAEAASPDVVTVARDADGTAHYFSRSTIPSGADPVWRHLGLYAYRKDAMARFVQAAPTELERTEKLEQLRALSLGLRIAAIEVTGATHAVDRPDDVAVVERVLRGEPPTTIRAVVLDVDGVLTDGRIQYPGDGDQLLSFDVKDGFGIAALLRAGVQVAFLSARDSAALRRRAAELGVAHVRAGVPDKAAALVELVADLGVRLAEVCVVGDDDPDVPLMELAGMSAAPADAAPAARSAARIVLANAGGRGAVRELADRLLATQGGAA